MKETNNSQEPYVYGSIGGSTVALVPEPKAPIPVAAAKPAQPAAPATDTLARDYQFAERVGTKEAWDSFLAAHKSGFFANLARAARDKIVAAEQRLKLDVAAARKAADDAKLKAHAAAKAKQEPVVVASAPNPPAATRTAAPIDPADLARLLQFHLKRVGCDPGALDGNWTEQSGHALQEFNKREKTKFDVKVASIGALDAVKQQKARVCPLVCGKGFKAEGDRCVAEACRRGYIRNKAGDCERETKSAAHPAQREQSGGGSRIFCSDRGGCRELPKNCRTVYQNGGVRGSGGGEVMVCN